jgi:hypothetical protein
VLCLLIFNNFSIYVHLVQATGEEVLLAATQECIAVKTRAVAYGVSIITSLETDIALVDKQSMPSLNCLKERYV